MKTTPVPKTMLAILLTLLALQAIATNAHATTVYATTTNITSTVGGTLYWAAATTPNSTPNNQTRVSHNQGTSGAKVYRPGQSNSTSGTINTTPAGYGWATNFTQTGDVPAGTWTFNVQTNGNVGGSNGTSYVTVNVFKRCGTTDTQLFSVQGSANTSANGNDINQTIQSTQGSFTTNGCYIKFEYWLTYPNPAPEDNTNRLPYINTALFSMDYPTPTGGGGDTTPPSPPTSVTATTLSQSSIHIAWSGATDNVGVTGYRVDVATDSGFNSMVSGWNNNNVNNVTQIDATGLSPSTTYYTRIRAYDAAGNTSTNSTTASTTTNPASGDTTAPSVPTNVAASALSSSAIHLSWSASTDNVGVTGYRVDVSTSSSYTSFVSGWNNTNVNNVLGVDVAALAGSTTYYARVRAYDAAGNTSTNSTTASATTQAGSGGNTCGNGIVDTGESCDGTLFSNGNPDCSAWGNYQAGTNVTCTPTCGLDMSACVAPSSGGGGGGTSYYDTCVPQQEICDGIDNDCDHEIDNGVDKTIVCGRGACMKVLYQVCINGQFTPACIPDQNPGVEVCNNIDDDCDGLVDDHLTQSCGTNVGTCVAGTQTCSHGKWSPCTGETKPTLEVCDEKDNNCDGNVDENTTCLTQAKTPCTEKWVCEDWGTCLNQKETGRSCQDLNHCGTTNDQPPLTKKCTAQPDPALEESLKKLQEFARNNTVFTATILTTIGVMLFIGLLLSRAPPEKNTPPAA